MAKKVDVTFKNPVDESFIDHLELWRKTGVGGTFAQVGTDFTFVTGTADYTYADTTASADGVTYYYEARAYNNNGGEVEGTDYNKIAANITISDAAVDFTLTNMTENSATDIQVDATFLYTNAWGVSTSAYSGDFEFNVAIENVDTNGTMIGLSTLGTGRAYNDGTNPWDYGGQISVTKDIKDIISGVITDSTVNCTNTAGDLLRLVRLSNNLKLYYNSTEIKDFGTITSSDLYILISQSSTSGGHIRTPQVV